MLEYIQAPVEYDLLMKLLTGLRIKIVKQKTHFLQLLKNLYIQKQVLRVWNQYLSKWVLDIGFNQSGLDKCVLYWSEFIFFLYVDDVCFLIPSSKYVERDISDLRESKKYQFNFGLKDLVDILDYLGINFVNAKMSTSNLPIHS